MQVVPGSIKPTDAFPYRTIPFSPVVLDAVMRRLVGLPYELGGKIPCSLTLDQAAKSSGVDCSGFVRFAIYKASGGQIALVDGSDSQHTQIRLGGFKQSCPADTQDKDGVLRIAFLTPAEGGGIGHVLLSLSGLTYESYGHADGHNHGKGGPGSRACLSEPFMAHMDVWCLTAPKAPRHDDH